MKKCILLFLSVVFIFGLSSCEKEENKTAGSNVNGLWLGNWVATDGISGTFVAPVSQNEKDFEGDLLIRFDLPSSENYGIEFEGTIENCVAKSTIGISGVDIYVKGKIEDDSVVSGSFNVTIGMTGTFEGKKVPLDSVSSTEVFRCNNCQEYYNELICVNENFWITCPSTDQIKVLNSNGEVIRTINGNFLNGQTVFDGTNFLMYGYEQQNFQYGLFSIDTLGNTVQSFSYNNPETSAFCLSNSDFYCADNINRTICNKEVEGNATECINTCNIFVDDMVFLNNRFYFISNMVGGIVFEMDLTGNIEKALRLTDGGIRSISSDNSGAIWCLIELYNQSSDSEVPTLEYSNYSLVRFNPD